MILPFSVYSKHAAYVIPSCCIGRGYSLLSFCVPRPHGPIFKLCGRDRKKINCAFWMISGFLGLHPSVDVRHAARHVGALWSFSWIAEPYT